MFSTYLGIQLSTNMLTISLKYTQSISHMIFFMYVAIIRCLIYTRQESKKIIFAVHASDTPVALKQDQGHQSWDRLADLKQGHNHANFERPCLDSV